MDLELQIRIQRYSWNKAAENYDLSWQQQLRPAQDELLKIAGLKVGEHVLDVACGTGLLTQRIAHLIGKKGLIVGTDISEKMLQLAQEALKNQTPAPTYFHRMEADAQEFPGASFDAILCSLGYMYFPNPLKSAQEQYRVLKPGGRVVAAIWGEKKNCGWSNIFPIVERRVKREVHPMFFHLGTGETLSRIFWMAGFSKIITQRINTVLSYSSPESACEAMFSGGPVAMAYSRLDTQTRAEVKAEYLSSIQAFREGEGYAIPGEFVVTKGIK